MSGPTTPMHVPVRRCIGCGRRAPQRELARFVAAGEYSSQQLVRDPEYRAPGRGAYVCAEAACFEKARARRAFHRALRRQGTELMIDPGLATSLAA